jgi:MFS family permease
VFAVTLVGRPIGATIFGHFGDQIGRQRTTMIAVAGFAVVTFLIALLPGCATSGVTAMVLLVLLRLLDGIFLGGEYTAATPSRVGVGAGGGLPALFRAEQRAVSRAGDSSTRRK